MARFSMAALAVVTAACGGPISVGDPADGGNTFTRGYGSISVGQIDLPGLPGSGLRTISARFMPNGPSGTESARSAAWRRALPSNCQLSTGASCELARCGQDMATLDAGTAANAGTLTVQGPGATNLALGQNLMTGDYATTLQDAGTWWNGGETFTVTASGEASGVPAFSTGVTAPPRLSFSNPAASSTAAVQGVPLLISWNPGPGELSIVLISVTQTESTLARCTVAANVSTFMVPATVTQALHPGAATMMLANTTEAVTTAGDWSLHFEATSIANYNLTVQ